MQFLISLCAACLLSFGLRRPLQKHAPVFYAAAAAVCTVLAVTEPPAAPAWLNVYVLDLFRRGTLGTALFAVVMYAGALPNGSKVMRMLMPVRGELSIVASILCLCHNVFYGRTYFVRLFAAPDQLSLPQLIAGILSLILIGVMLPLFVTSFKRIRRTMSAARWKKLQRWAYLYYFLLYVHIAVLMLPFAFRGKTGYALSVTVYSIVYGVYGFLRFGKSRLRFKIALRMFCAAAAVAVTAAAWLGCAAAGAADAAERQAETSGRRPVSEVTASAVAEPSGPGDAAAPTGSTDADPADAGCRDGTYTGSGPGYVNRITVEVDIESGKMTAIRVKQHTEDQPYMDRAMTILDRMVEAQSHQVDTVSGATSSCEGLMTAVRRALAKASSGAATP